MTTHRRTTRLQRLEQTAARQAQHARLVLVEWHEGEETEAEALTRAGVDPEDESQIVVLLKQYT